MIKILLPLVFLSPLAFSEPDLDKAKAEAGAHLDKRISILQEAKTCISAAASKEKLHECRKELKEDREEVRADRMEKRKERLEERQKKMEERKKKQEKASQLDLSSNLNHLLRGNLEELSGPLSVSRHE